jgi:hypothetical protein
MESFVSLKRIPSSTNLYYALDNSNEYYMLPNMRLVQKVVLFIKICMICHFKSVTHLLLIL